MPSETIYGSHAPVDVRVSWGSVPDGEVQVATLMHTRSENDGPLVTPTDRILKIVNDWLREAGMNTIDVEELKRRSPHEPFFDGWHATLGDWASVNTLIKVLKRARDKQFGVPE